MSAPMPVNDCAPLTFPTLTSSDSHHIQPGPASVPLQAPLGVPRSSHFPALADTNAAERVRRICAINVQAAAKAVVWVHPANSEQRETALLHKLHALFSLEGGISLSFIAQEASQSQATISQYFAGRYCGHQDIVEMMLTRFIDLYVRGVFDAKLIAKGKTGLSRRYERTEKMAARERNWEQTLIAQVFAKFTEIARENETAKMQIVSTAALSVERVEGQRSQNESMNAHFARARQFRQQLYMLQQQKIILEQQERLILEQSKMLKRSAAPSDLQKQHMLSTAPPNGARPF